MNTKLGTVERSWFAIWTITAALALASPAAFGHGDGDDHDHDHDGEHAEGDHHHDHDDHGATFQLGSLIIDHPWTRETDGPTAQVFMLVENRGDAADSLIGAETDMAGSVTITATTFGADGTAGEALDAMVIEAGQDFPFAPDEVYLLLEDLSGHLHHGDEFTMTLMFASSGSVDVLVEVADADATEAPHDH